jgi:hypothetical protein
MKAVTVKHGTYSAEYGDRLSEGDVVVVPDEVADRWERIGMADPGGDVAKHDRAREKRYHDVQDEQERPPPVGGTKAQREAQEAELAVREAEVGARLRSAEQAEKVAEADRASHRDAANAQREGRRAQARPARHRGKE